MPTLYASQTFAAVNKTGNLRKQIMCSLGNHCCRWKAM